MQELDITPFSRDSLEEMKERWYLKRSNIYWFGFLLGALSTLCFSAIINLLLDDDLRDLFLIWRNIPINVWISILSFVIFVMFTVYFSINKK